jgi:hypothetical protein
MRKRAIEEEIGAIAANCGVSMEKKSDNRVCMDNKAGFEKSNLLNPVGSQARDYQSTSQPEWSSAWSNRPGRTRTRRSISRPYLSARARHTSRAMCGLNPILMTKSGAPQSDSAQLRCMRSALCRHARSARTLGCVLAAFPPFSLRKRASSKQRPSTTLNK